MSAQRTITQRLMSGSMLVTLGKIVAAGSALILNVLLTRLLQPNEVGVYYLLASVVMMFGLAAQLGVHQAIVRVLAGSSGAEKKGASRKSIRSAFIIVTFGIVIIAVPYALSIGDWLGEVMFDLPLMGNFSVITALWIGCFALQMLLSQMFRGFHCIGQATLFEGTSTGIFVVLGLGFVWLAYKQLVLHDVLMITIAALLLSIVLGLFFLKNYYKQAVPSEGVGVQGMLKISLPLFVSSTAVVGIAELHILILGSVNSEDVVAIYGAAFRLAKFIVIPLLIINSVIPPMIAQLVAQKKMDEVERVLRVTAAVAGVPVIFLLAAIIFWATNILDFFYGGVYAQGASVLIILVAAQAINTLTGSPGVLLMMSNYQVIVMKLALLSGVLGVMTSLILVQPFGDVGVALGAGVGLVVHNIGMWAYCKYKLGVDTHMSIKALRGVVLTAYKKYA